MLLQNNDTAKYIRNRILDIVIDVLAEKTGGSTKYINQKDPDFLPMLWEKYKTERNLLMH